MAMTLTPEQTDWLTKFLARSLPAMSPEMTINTSAGFDGSSPAVVPAPVPGAEPGVANPEAPGLYDRFDAAVNDLGKSIFGDAGRRSADEARGDPPPSMPEPPPAAPASEIQPAWPGLYDRLDAAVNDLGKSIFGDAGTP